MALTITHRRVSAIADDPSHPEEIQPSDWGSTASVLPTHIISGTIDPGDLDLSGVVPITRTVNGLPLSGNISLTPTLLGLGLVENVALSTWAGSANLVTLGALPAIVVGGAVAPAGVEGYFASASAADPRGLMSAQYSTDATGARFHLRKARGTEALPTTIVTGDVLGRVRFSGYDGANYLQMAGIAVVATGTIGATRVPTYMTFSVATDAAPSVLTEVLRLSPTGITFGAPIVGVQTTSVNGIVTTSSDGSVLQNTTPATVGVPVQISPRARLSGTTWATTGGASHVIDFFTETLPVTGAAATGIWRVGYSLDGAAATYPLTLTSAGVLTAPTVTLTTGSLTVPGAQTLAFLGRGFFASPGSGFFSFLNATGANGAQININTLPTIASGFGGGAAVTTGSTPSFGSVNVGTGGAATSGVITFNASFPSAPFVVCMNTTTGAVVRATATTTQLTITAPVAFVANDVIVWHCVSSK